MGTSLRRLACWPVQSARRYPDRQSWMGKWSASMKMDIHGSMISLSSSRTLLRRLRHSLNGRDLRWNALIEKKAELRRLLGFKTSRVLYADHVEREGCRLFELICQRDLEGIVAKLKHGHYPSDREESTWIKIKNRNYSQGKGRAEFFHDAKKPAMSIHAGWDSCSLVCEETEMAL
jgi:hypothetical protein